MISIKAPSNPEKAVYNFKVTLPGGRHEFVCYSYDQLKTCKSKFYDECGSEIFLRGMSLENRHIYSGTLIRCCIDFRAAGAWINPEPISYVFNCAPFLESLPGLHSRLKEDRGILVKNDEYYEELIEKISRSVPLVNDAMKVAPKTFTCRVNLYDLLKDDESFWQSEGFNDDGAIWETYKKEEFYIVRSNGESFFFSSEQEWVKAKEDARSFLIRNGFSVEYIGFEEGYKSGRLVLWDTNEIVRFNEYPISSALTQKPSWVEALINSENFSGTDLEFLVEYTGCTNVVLLNIIERLKRVGRPHGFDLFIDDIMIVGRWCFDD